MAKIKITSNSSPDKDASGLSFGGKLKVVNPKKAKFTALKKQFSVIKEVNETIHTSNRRHIVDEKASKPIILNKFKPLTAEKPMINLYQNQNSVVSKAVTKDANKTFSKLNKSQSICSNHGGFNKWSQNNTRNNMLTRIVKRYHLSDELYRKNSQIDKSDPDFEHSLEYVRTNICHWLSLYYHSKLNLVVGDLYPVNLGLMEGVICD